MTEPRRPAELLAVVGAKLARLPRRVVFIGGATTELFITDPAAPEIRATLDVDVVVEVDSYAEYVTEVAAELRALGAQEDASEGAPLCRWVLDGVRVDVMAPSEKVLGFTNRWYARALDCIEARTLPNGTVINLTTGPLFLATKIEAFRGRGEGDFWGSKDMEDIVALLDGRSELIGEIAAAEEELRTFLRDTFQSWLGGREFREAIAGHLPGDADSQERAEVIIERIEEILRTDGEG